MKQIFKSIGLTRAVFALSLARMSDAMGNSILFIIIPLYVAKLPDVYFKLPVPVLVGLLISLYGLINSGTQPLMGALSDRLNRRKTLIQVGLFVMGVSTLTFISASKFLDLLLLRTLQGIGVAMTVPASLALMAAITKKESRGGSMGIYSTMRIIGFVAGPLIGGFLQVHFGFNAAFVAGAGFIFLAMLLVQLWVQEVKIDNSATQTKRFRIVDKSLLNPGILSAALATFVMATTFTLVTTLENEFNTRLNINALGFSFAFSVLMFGRLLFQVPLGRWSDSIGRKPLVLTGLILTAPVVILQGEVTNLFQFSILRVIQGIASAAIAAPVFAVAADLSQKGGEGRQMSIITMGFGLGIAFGPLLAGILAVIYFELPFVVGGILIIIAAIIVQKYMPETVQKRLHAGQITNNS